MSEVGRDRPLLGCDVAATALDELAERMARLERVVEQIAGAPVPLILESFVDGEQVPKERVQNRVGEPIGDRPSAPDLGTYRRSCAAPTTGARAESFPGADYGFPCASAHGGRGGS